MEINDIRQHQKREKKIRWNTKNKNGWTIYKENTDNNKELDQTWRSKDVQKEWKGWSKVVNKNLRESLGKIRISEKKYKE